MKRNISFVIYSLNSGGAERVVSSLSNGLYNDYNVTIITLINTKPFYYLENNIKVITCRNNIEPSKNFFASIQYNFQLYKNIKEICKRESIDLLIGFMTTTNILTILVSKSLNIPVIVSERIYPPFAKLSKFWRIMRRITYPKASILVVQTKPILDFFRALMPEGKIKILANPISSKHSEARTNIIIEKENIILNVGRLTAQKGQDVAIRAFAKVNPPNWQLHLVGEGPKRNEYSSLISELGMDDKIILVGRNNQISEYYLRAKIFVFPSRFEGFPNALTEAMYMGLPCISTDCPTGPSELIENNINGFLTVIDDVELFAKKIKDLVYDSNLREQIGTKAAASVAHLEEDKVVAQWQKLIAGTLQNS